MRHTCPSGAKTQIADFDDPFRGATACGRRSHKRDVPSVCAQRRRIRFPFPRGSRRSIRRYRSRRRRTRCRRHDAGIANINAAGIRSARRGRGGLRLKRHVPPARADRWRKARSRNNGAVRANRNSIRRRSTSNRNVHPQACVSEYDLSGRRSAHGATHDGIGARPSLKGNVTASS